MAKKAKHGAGGILYSTDPDFVYSSQDGEAETLPPGEQRLRVSLDKRHRKGKVVTLVTGFSGKPEDLDTLGKKLKTACGTGGSAKDAEILVQGDHLAQVTQLLAAWGYRVS